MQIVWRPGIGDPTVTGWMTVLAYFVAAALALRATKQAQLSGRNWQSESRFWFCVALITLALGINKQLDLQSLFTELARSAAKDGGWYEQRRTYQSAFILMVGGSGILAAVTLLFWARRLGVAQQTATFGLSLLVAYIVIRAASFHHFDQMISGSIIGARWSSLLELVGAATIGLSALGYTRMSVRKKRRR